jgi:hypothetical protein
MKVRKYFLSASVGLCLGFGILATTSVTARATIVFSQPEADFSGTPYTINFGNGAATYTFTDIYDPLADPFTVAAVSTGGTAMVNSFLGQPIAFQLGTVVGATGYEFAPLPAATGIPFSISEDSIGLEFSLSDGIHYGFVITRGPELFQYGYNTTPGGLITIGVPEPKTWVMLIVGFGILGAAAGLKAVHKPRLA